MDRLEVISSGISRVRECSASQRPWLLMETADLAMCPRVVLQQ